MVLLKLQFPHRKRVRLAQGLWLLSWVTVLAGAFTFSLGVFLKTELLRRAEVMDNTEIHVVPNILMLVGLVIIGINMLAGRICQDSLDSTRFPPWKPFLLPWYGLSGMVSLWLFSAVVLSYALQGQLEESLKVGLRNGIRFYRDTDVPGRCFQKETIDKLQIELRCCGNTNYKDWFEVQWISNRYLDFTSKEVKDRVRSNVDSRYLVDGVPFSCCNPASPRPCLQYHLTDNAAHYNYEHQSEELNLYNRGCREALVDYYMGLMNTIGPGVLSVILLQMSVLVSLRFLETSLACVDPEDPEGDSVGYILSKGFKETMMDVKATILKGLQFGQVTAADGGEGTAGADGEKAATSS